MGTTVFTPLQHLIEGQLQGHQIANMIRRTALEQEAMERSQFQQERENEIQDISIQQKLLSAGRPVEGGSVRDKMLVPQISGAIGDQARRTMPTGEGQSFEYMRKPDSSRTVKHKTIDGRT